MVSTGVGNYADGAATEGRDDGDAVVGANVGDAVVTVV